MSEETPENGTGSEVPEIELIIKVSFYILLFTLKKTGRFCGFFFICVIFAF